MRVLAAVLVALGALGWSTPAVAGPAYPRAEGWCVDQAGVLGRTLCARITAVLQRDEKATSDEIAVAVVRTTADTSIEDWSTGLFNRWGIGKRSSNNGVLLVVALDDHRVRLATGRGLAVRLDDATAGQIVDTYIMPEFARARYALGVLTGLDQVRRQLGHTITAGQRLRDLAEKAPAAPAASAAQVTEDPEELLPGGDGDFEVAESTSSTFSFMPVLMAVPCLLVVLIVAVRAISGTRRTHPVRPARRNFGPPSEHGPYPGSGHGQGNGAAWTAAATGTALGAWAESNWGSSQSPDPSGGSSSSDSSSWGSSSSDSFSWGGSSSDSGGSSFGGGSSDGGGSSGSW
ncbi:hypothetical protein Asi03nite_68160 [Actinoplanes siamensis]|uniref:TPM domain-containing protein n=1 Tax=Actinoplanes siamensis TaxID=1223317 RepID=A0A919TPM4_9ACTN|nr:hypothetical protein Asi03nite_68160 [Actinoplanes siamensis]